MFSQSGSSLFVILISANLNDQQLIDYYPYNASKVIKKRQALSSIPLSYAAVWPSGKCKAFSKNTSFERSTSFSDPCSCRPSLGNQFYLCSNVLSSPCNCKNSTYCQVHVHAHCILHIALFDACELRVPSF